MQKVATDAEKEKIEEAVIENLDIDQILTTTSTTLVRIADLGCSIGPNTFFAVQNLIQAVQTKHREIEFQVLFNDHSTNDFNTLFASLPPDRQYHAAGVPGSFHGRLFPRGSITLAHCSQSLHWLSQQPQGLHNEGRIHYTGALEDVARAYFDQFDKDMGVFMSARADEIVSGGLMFLVMPGTPNDHADSNMSVLFDFFGSSFMDLVHQGVVEKRIVDAFNLPIYFPRLEEMRKVIEKNGCFSIQKMELTNPRSKLKQEPIIDAAVVIKHMRAVLEGLLTSHFGASVVDKMFDNICAKTQQVSRFFNGHRYTSRDQLFVVLRRK